METAQGSATRTDPAAPLRQRLRAALGVAMKAGDRVAVAALRSGLSAIENAEAVDRGEDADRGLAIEQIAIGVGATEAERRVLTEADSERIVRGEIDEREAAARDYDLAGRPERAERLRGEAQVLVAQLADGPAAG